MSLTRPSLLDTVLSDRPPMLWWFSHGEWRDAVTCCFWDKLWKWRYWKSRRKCKVYGLSGVCFVGVGGCVCAAHWSSCARTCVCEGVCVCMSVLGCVCVCLRGVVCVGVCGGVVVGVCVSVWGCVCVYRCLLSDLTSLPPPWWREKLILFYYPSKV